MNIYMSMVSLCTMTDSSVSQQRCQVWRTKLMGSPDDIQHKRTLYKEYVEGHGDVSNQTLHVIAADVPRTWAQHPLTGRETISQLLVEYAAVQRGDSYLQGFSYIMTVFWMVFHTTPEARADTWWCFSRVVGLVRPLMPDFNTKWFHWYRLHWLENFNTQLQRKCPVLSNIISDEMEIFSSLITVKWFMLWFSQTIAFEDIFKLWDFLISVPPHHLMQAYAKITLEIICEAAPQLTYTCFGNATNTVHQILKMRVNGIEHILERVANQM
jgi:hypothetical protein